MSLQIFRSSPALLLACLLLTSSLSFPSLLVFVFFFLEDREER